MWKTIRIIILLFILLKAVQQSYAESIDLAWQNKFYVAVYPVNGETRDKDASKEVNAHIKHLANEDFSAITAYFTAQAKAYDLPLHRPIEVVLGPEVDVVPPAPPESQNVAKVMLWSLGFRFYDWAFSPNKLNTKVEPDIKLYLVYHDPNTTPALGISTALDKGRIGRINLYADRGYHDKNLVVVAHELLHTLKASDKYDLSTNIPVFPNGYAEPHKLPLYPQRYAELMGGRLPIEEQVAYMPQNLSETIIGQQTAKEIGWIQ